jgi:hypothetical protein
MSDIQQLVKLKLMTNNQQNGKIAMQGTVVLHVLNL